MKSFMFNPCLKREDRKKSRCPGPNDIVAYYTQVVVEQECIIPMPKPDSEKIVNRFYETELSKIDEIETATAMHGTIVPGKKVVVSGCLKLGLEYSANLPDQKVHYFACDIPFHGIIIQCSHEMEYLLPFTFCIDYYTVQVCVEHLEIRRISERIFEVVAVLMIWLQPVPNING